MKKIFSKIDTSKLIACIINKNQINNYRQDLAPEDEYLQVSARKFKKEVKVLPHKHLTNKRNITRTQEAWIIIEGSVEFELFDLNDKLLTRSSLFAGDCLVLFNGGHSLNVLDENTVMYEIKNGPYLGIEKDKINI